jgi:signal peptidase
MFKKLKTVFKIIEWILFVVLLCLLFVVISPKLPIKNLPKSFVVVSGSMEPTIKTGSVAFTKTIDPKNIKSGDIIAFTSPNDAKDTILHRVNSISSTDPLLFKTKGDNNNDIDAWDVQDVGVKGVYFFAIPYLGTLAATLRQPWGFSLVVGIPALIFIIGQILNIKKAIDEEVNRKVSQKLQEKEVKDSNSTKNLKSIIFFLIFSTGILGLNHLNTAKALYSDSVVVSGITISTADFTKTPAPILKFSVNRSFTTTNPGINLSSDYSNHQINLTVNNISQNFDYEILYTANGVEKGVFEHATTDEIINSKFSKNIYLGICSAGGTCVADDILPGSTITVNISGGQTLTKTFTY